MRLYSAGLPARRIEHTEIKRAHICASKSKENQKGSYIVRSPDESDESDEHHMLFWRSFEFSASLCQSLPFFAILYHSLPFSTVLCNSLPSSAILYHSLSFSASLSAKCTGEILVWWDETKKLCQTWPCYRKLDTRWIPVARTSCLAKFGELRRQKSALIRLISFY